MEKYDLIILGAGPAGLSAAIYAGRYKLNTLILDPMPGGIPNFVPEIQNWPGEQSISGIDLAQKLIDHAKKYNIKIKLEKAESITKTKDTFTINKKYSSKSILLAMGTKEKEINLENLEKFKAKGVHWCTSCDAPFYQNKITAVIGGSNSALSGALFLTQYAKEVYIIYRQDKFFRADKILVDEINKNKKIKVIFKANVIKLKGSNKLESIKLDTGKELKLDGLFIEIGRTPLTELVKDLDVKLNKEGRIIVDNYQRTNIKGIYAAGDITTGSAEFDQLVTASAEGTIAAKTIFEDLQKNK